MSKETDRNAAVLSDKQSLFAFQRFIASLLVLLILAVADLFSHETVPTMVYLLVGGLNGVDSYKLYKEIKN